MGKFLDNFYKGMLILIGVIIGHAAAKAFVDPPKPVLSKHAVLAIMACNELKLENETVSSTYSSTTKAYKVEALCSGDVKIILNIPKVVVKAKEA